MTFRKTLRVQKRDLGLVSRGAKREKYIGRNFLFSSFKKLLTSLVPFFIQEIYITSLISRINFSAFGNAASMSEGAYASGTSAFTTRRIGASK